MRKIPIWLAIITLIASMTTPVEAASKPVTPKLAAPVLTTVKVNFNGKQYVPMDAPRFINGTLYTSVMMATRLLGAEVNVNGNQVTIVENNDTLKVNLGTTNAVFNNKEMIMPKAAVMANGVPLLPLRFVFELFSAQVKYNAGTQRLSIDRVELRDDLEPDDMLVMNEKMVDKKNLMKINWSSDKSVTKTQNGVTSTNTEKKDVCMYGQAEPEVFYIKGTQTIDVDGKQRSIDIEAISKNNIEYIKLPLYGWTIMPPRDREDQGTDIMSEEFDLGYDEDFDEFGALTTYSNDQEKNGKKYWVVEVTLGPQALQEEVQNSPEYADIIKKDPKLSSMFRNGRFDKVCRIWINKDTKLLDFYEMSLNLEMKYVDPKSKMRVYRLATEMKGSYTFAYDIGFEVPSVGSNPPKLEDVINDDSYMNES